MNHDDDWSVGGRSGQRGTSWEWKPVIAPSVSCRNLQRLVTIANRTFRLIRDSGHKNPHSGRRTHPRPLGGCLLLDTGMLLPSKLPLPPYTINDHACMHSLHAIRIPAQPAPSFPTQGARHPLHPPFWRHTDKRVRRIPPRPFVRRDYKRKGLPRCRHPDAQTWLRPGR